MSVVTNVENKIDQSTTVPTDSLIEHFYLNYGLKQLIELQAKKPPARYLLAWNVTPNQFRSDLSSAIEMVRVD